MPAELLSSKLVVVFEDSKTPTIQGLPTMVLGMTGVAERGEIGVSKLVTSLEGYYEEYGGPTLDGTLYVPVMLYYVNGGRFLWVDRETAHTGVGAERVTTAIKATLDVPTNATQATYGSETSTETAPFTLASGDTLSVNVDDVAEPFIATFTGTSASVETGAETFALGFVEGSPQTLVVKVNDGEEQTCSFEDDATASAVEVAQQINAAIDGVKATVVAGPAVKIETDRKGQGATLQIMASSTALTALTLVETTETGTGNVDDLSSVSAQEFNDIVEAAVTGSAVLMNGDGTVTVRTTTSGTAGKIKVNTSNVQIKLGFDTSEHQGTASGVSQTFKLDGKTEGEYANSLTFRVESASSGEAARFNFTVMFGGSPVESFPNLTMDDADTRYAGTIINHVTAGSRYVAFTDYNLVGSAEAIRPANNTSLGPMTGGDDGLSGMGDTDFTGDEVKEDGLYSFNKVADLTTVAIPNEGTAAIANALIQYCEVERDGLCFAIIDPPIGQSYTEVVTWVTTTASLLESSECAATFWPWLLVSNKWTSVFGTAKTVTVSPAGAIAGLYARIDASRPGGVHVTPAGIDNGQLFGVVGFEGCENGQTHEVQNERKRDYVYPNRINPITKAPGTPIYVDGSRTLKSTGNWPFVAQIRGVQHIARSLKFGLNWTRHKNNTKAMRDKANRSATAFMLGEMYNDAFVNQNPAEAFFVDTSDALNPPSIQAQGKFFIRVGIAKATPAEWTIIRIAKDTRALDAELAGSAG